MLTWIEDAQPLPPPDTALGHDSDAHGLAGHRRPPVTPRCLKEAYRQGIFPWYRPGQPVLWWSPDPRMVLPVAEFRVAHSVPKTLRRIRRTPRWELRFDSAFEQVIHACARTPPPGEDGTWIVRAMVTAWHRAR